MPREYGAEGELARHETADPIAPDAVCRFGKTRVIRYTSSMADPLGSLCIVLHGHLPYVLRHGGFPHGEVWLFEAAAETYLPLIEMLADAVQHKVRPGITVGLTPVLLEQLAHEQFKTGFVAYLHERIERATADAREFEAAGQADFASLARHWERWYSRRLAHFEKLGRDIVAPLAAHYRNGDIQLLTSCATHAYLPLLLTDEAIGAQLAAGASISKSHLGQAASGMWLPECGYRPANEHWKPPVLWNDPRYRPGIERLIAEAGIGHFFVETRQFQEAAALGTFDDGVFSPVVPEQIYWDGRRAWRDPLRPAGVASEAGAPVCFALARHPRVSEQVWSSVVGYPGSPAYLEFHRRRGEGGLRYHRVTDVKVDLANKAPYKPEDAFATLFENANAFSNVVRQTLAVHERQTGSPGVVVAPFDAELFGHWWHEGIRFLRDVIAILARDKSVRLVTADEALREHRPTTVLRLPEGSWGKDGDHSVWLNQATRGLWEIEYRAEARLLTLLRELPWRTDAAIAAMLGRAGRELLLMQASDWPFVIHSGGASDYGLLRFSGHASRFDRLATIAQSIAVGRTVSAVQQTEIDEADAHDVIFANVDLEWWKSR